MASQAAGTSAGSGGDGNYASLSSEIEDRIRILKLTPYDSPRLAVKQDEFRSLAAGRDGGLGKDKLNEVVSILRWLCNEQNKKS